MTLRAKLTLGAVVLVGVVLLFTKFASAALKRMAPSNTAKRMGLPNAPATNEHRDRLVWLDRRRAEVLRVLRTKYPKARFASGYRSPKVNAAIDGSPNSRHCKALGMDFGGCGGDYDPVARHLRDNAHRLLVQPRLVFSEKNPPHLHMDYRDPLDIIEGDRNPPGKTPATWYKTEVPGRKRGERRQSIKLA